MKVLLSFLGLLVKAQQCSLEVKDLTVTPGSTGEDVARATLGKVWSEISTWDARFVDAGFLERYAYAESNYGLVQHHPVQQIWSIDEEQFNNTKTAALKTTIGNKFNVVWDNLKYEELTTPTNSILAFVLYLEYLNEFPISFSIDTQDTLFKTITHNTVDAFKDKVDELDQNIQNECSTKALDIVFLVDESGSVREEDFNLVKDFLVDYANDSTIAADATRIAIRTYSTGSRLHFSLNDFKTMNITYEIQNMVYASGGTNTADAINAALDNDFGFDRPESVKILVTMTDGQSNLNDMIAVASRIKGDPRNIQSFAIGIAGAMMDELKAIATTDPGHISMLNDWSDFEDIKKNLQSKVCEGDVENNNGGDTQVGGSAGSPGKIILKIGMTGKDNFDFTADAPLTFFYHRTNPQPGPAAHERVYNFTSSDASANKLINYNVGPSQTFVYLSAYNYHPSNALVSLDIKNGGGSGPIVPDPVICPPNSHCVGGTCECFSQYLFDAMSGECVYNDNCAHKNCANGYQCAPATGDCICPPDFVEQNGNCYEPICPTSPVQITNPHFAMGELSSPWFENGWLYPNNFDCTYEFEMVRADGGCFGVVIEHPFGMEHSVDCENDRLEIFGVVNADEVNMDHSGSRPAGSAVLCGDACVAEGGWMGTVCEDKLQIRFKSDELMNDIGWRITWIRYNKHQCPSMCNNP